MDPVSFSPSIVILLGPPGSGKGTQAKRLAKDFNLPHISTGDLFRENIANQTEIGKKAQHFMAKGQLVPDEIVMDMLYDRFKRPDCQNGFLLDGVPRTIFQADQLAANLKEEAWIHVLCLEVPDNEIVKRALGRLSCQACGLIYNRNLLPHKGEEPCPACAGKLVARADDREEIVRERLRIYHAQTKPLVEYYDRLGLLTVFDGNQSPDVVFDELSHYLKNR